MTSVRSIRWAAAGIVLGLTLAACESTKIAGGHGPEEPPVSPAPPVATDGSAGGGPFGFVSSGDANFDGWRTAFAARADGSGRNDAVIRSVLDGLVPVEQIAWIEAEGMYVNIHTRDGATHLHRGAIGSLEEALDGRQFVRIHRSAIVNIERIMNLAHVLRIRDEATPTSNARPPGAAGWEVWAKIGGEAEPLSVEECTYMGLATRVPYVVQFGPDDKNKTVWYLVRAINAKGQAGPVSDQISGTIAA
jgi:hypothetical protein